jgi:hypothetical protein
MYNGSWNLSFTLACCSALCIARANDECVCVFKRNLNEKAQPKSKLKEK